MLPCKAHESHWKLFIVTLVLFLVVCAACTRDIGPTLRQDSNGAVLQVDKDIAVRVGDSADDTFLSIGMYDTGKSFAEQDPSNPESLAVHHWYEIKGKRYHVEFRRREDPGPYRVFSIAESRS